MDFNEYQELARRTSKKDGKSLMDCQINGVLGLAGESGEVADIYKKHMFQDHELDTDKVINEMGDILWYLSELSYGLGIPLSEVAELNIEKLRKRYPQGFESDRSINREEYKNDKS